MLRRVAPKRFMIYWVSEHRIYICGKFPAVNLTLAFDDKRFAHRYPRRNFGKKCANKTEDRIEKRGD